MRNLKNKLLVLFFVVIGSTGCSLYMKQVVGYHDIFKKDYPKILEIGDSAVNVKQKMCPDTYFIEIKEFEIPDTIKKYFFQPVQILYIKNGESCSFIANCFVRGSLKGLKWSEDEFFKSYPPKTHIKQAYITELVRFLHLSQSDLQQNTFVLLWSNMVTKEAYRALEAIENYIKKYDIPEALIILFNTDDAYRKLLEK